MAVDRFDPEEFLDLKDVTPQYEERGVTPLVAPPVYARRRPIPGPVRPSVILEAEVQRPAPRRDDSAPLAVHPAPPRQPSRPTAPAGPGMAAPQAPARAHPPVAHHIPGQPRPAPAAPAPAPGAAGPAPTRPDIPAESRRAPPPIRHNIPGEPQTAGAPIRHNVPGAPLPAQAAPVRHDTLGAPQPARAPVHHNIPGDPLPAQAPIRHNIPGVPRPAPASAIQHDIPPGPRPARAPVQHHIPGTPHPAQAPIRHNIPGAQAPASAPVLPGLPAEAGPFHAPAPRRPQPEADAFDPPPPPAVPARDAADDPFAGVIAPAPVAAPLPARTPVQDHSGTQGGAVVSEPLAVGYRGREFRAQSWSVSGFTLTEALPVEDPAQGRVIDVTLLIGQGVTRIEMRVQARAETAGAAAPTRFVFVDLDRAQAEVLHRIVDQVVSNKALTLTQLLNETETDRTARRATGERMRRFRSTFQLTLAALVLAAAGGVTWNSLTAVSSRYGAVTVGATSLSVPVAGVVTAIAMTPGQAVAQGDVLGYVRPADFDRQQTAMGSRRDELLQEQAELTARRGAMTQLSAISSAGAETDRARLDQQMSLAQRRLDIERQQLATLRASGLPTAERQQARAAQEARVLQAESDMLDIRARLDQLDQAAALAPLGVPGGDLRSSTQTLDIIDLRLAAVGAELARIEAMGFDSALGQPVTSPCDCVVQRVERRNGEWADPNQQLAVLVGSEAPTVHALVLSEDARKIAIGDRASIWLADGTALQGRVLRMNYDPHWRGYAGLQDDVFAADRYARIEVRPDVPLTQPVGMVASVTIQTSAIWGWLRATVGL